MAASIHDYDHPGVNNNFLIATQDKRALFYNDKSVLENHHCAAAFQQLVKPSNNFLQKLDNKQFKIVRTNIIEMVLATDLAQHFDLLTSFKTKVYNVNKIVTAQNFDPFSSKDDKQVLMKILMKCADVSNPTKKMDIYCEWIDRITTEFYTQGDLEHKLGLQISPFMNREQKSSAQKGFIEFIVFPLYEALEQFTPINEIKTNLIKSRERFCDIPTEIPIAAPDQTHNTSKRKVKEFSLKLNTDGVIQEGSRSADVITNPTLGIIQSVRRSSVVAISGLRNYVFNKPTNLDALSTIETGIREEEVEMK
jgi:hypothetical protein